ncbi:PF20097 family protein [Peptostreptococcaceae bacterium AGR-M142]
MLCPYCKEEMLKGLIVGQKGELKWYEHEKSEDFLKERLGIGGEKISINKNFMPVINSYKCLKCEKIVVDLKENKE